MVEGLFSTDTVEKLENQMGPNFGQYSFFSKVRFKYCAWGDVGVSAEGFDISYAPSCLKEQNLS